VSHEAGREAALADHGQFRGLQEERGGGREAAPAARRSGCAAAAAAPALYAPAGPCRLGLRLLAGAGAPPPRPAPGTPTPHQPALALGPSCNLDCRRARAPARPCPPGPPQALAAPRTSSPRSHPRPRHHLPPPPTHHLPCPALPCPRAGGTFAFLKSFLPHKSAISCSLVDITDLEAVRAAIRPNTKVRGAARWRRRQCRCCSRLGGGVWLEAGQPACCSCLLPLHRPAAAVALCALLFLASIDAPSPSTPLTPTSSHPHPHTLALIPAPPLQLIYTEVLANPTLAVSDIPALAQLAHSRGLQLVVDNTFSPCVVSPARLGADVVVHRCAAGGAGRGAAWWGLPLPLLHHALLHLQPLGTISAALPCPGPPPPRPPCSSATHGSPAPTHPPQPDQVHQRRL
jgi:hypothetical protein